MKNQQDAKDDNKSSDSGENEGLKYKQVIKFTKKPWKIKDIEVVPTPVDVSHQVKYKRFYQAKMIKMDHDRVSVIDWLLANLFKIFLLIKDRFW